MKENFESWMREAERKVPGTVKNYAWAIDKMSQHYSGETGKFIDIYRIDDIFSLKNICKKYNTDGIYAAFGKDKHGLCRAAIKAYVRFFEAINNCN